MPFDDTGKHGDGGGGGGGDDPSHDRDRFDKLANQIGLKTVKIAADRGLCVDCLIRRTASLMVTQMVLNHLLSDRLMDEIMRHLREHGLKLKPGVHLVEGDVPDDTPTFSIDKVSEQLDDLFHLMRAQVLVDLHDVGVLE